MKSAKSNNAGIKVANFANPIAKMIADKKRIIDAKRNNKPLASLKGINFAKPL